MASCVASSEESKPQVQVGVVTARAVTDNTLIFQHIKIALGQFGLHPSTHNITIVTCSMFEESPAEQFADLHIGFSKRVLFPAKFSANAICARNKQLAEAVDHLIAFPCEGSTDTWATIRQFRKILGQIQRRPYIRLLPASPLVAV